MKYWNLNDERLIRRLQAEIVGHDALFELGPDGGVAVYCGVRFLGVWIELRPTRFSFVPAARLQPTLLQFDIAQVVTATRAMVDDNRAYWHAAKASG